MGPSRKRVRTTPPSAEENGTADSTKETTKPSTPEADKHKDVVNKGEDTATPLKPVKSESSSSKQVSPWTRVNPQISRMDTDL